MNMLSGKIRYILFILLLALCLLHNSHADHIFEIVTHEHVPPHIYRENGISKGIDVDIVKELFERIKVKYEIKHYPWKRAVVNLETGVSDMLFPAFKTEEREKFAYYPEYPIEIMKFSLFVRKDSIFKYEKAEDLKGKKIGLVRGYSAGPVFDEARRKNYFTVEETNSTEADIMKLMSGRIDCFVQQYTVARFLIKKAGLSDKIVELKNPVDKTIPTYIIVSRKREIENIDELLKKINTALKEMWDDGTIENIIKKYIG